MNDEVTVDLVASSIPGTLGLVDHHWFVVSRPSSVDRWEVWQSQGAGGESWGHLHKNLMPPWKGIRWSSARPVCRWTGREAAELARRIESAPEEYPWRDKYHYWPGPNSNTFVQWALQESFTLSRRGIGSKYWKC